jgi:hypothetical protein
MSYDPRKECIRCTKRGHSSHECKQPAPPLPKKKPPEPKPVEPDEQTDYGDWSHMTFCKENW